VDRVLREWRACWLELRREAGFLVTLALASIIWLVIVLVPRWIGRSPR